MIVTDGMLKLWFAKFRLPSDAVTVSSAEELHRRYGEIFSARAVQNPTAYRLTSVLKARTPPLVCLRRCVETMAPKVFRQDWGRGRDWALCQDWALGQDCALARIVLLARIGSLARIGPLARFVPLARIGSLARIGPLARMGSLARIGP